MQPVDGQENPIIDILYGEEQPPDWLVPEMLLQGTMVCYAGEPGTGKSYVSYTIAIAVASGCAALSGLIQAGEPRRVLYFDEENSRQDRNKYLRRVFQGLTYQNKEEPDIKHLALNLWCPPEGTLGNEDWRERAAEWIEWVRPHLIIFDTASPCFCIEDENDNGKANAVIKEVKALKRLVDPVATALVIRHAKSRVEGQRRSMRGAKTWHGSVDGVIFQVKAAGRPRKDGLSLTRMESDKVRAYGFSGRIYITPEYINDQRSGMQLLASRDPNKAHTAAEQEEEKEAEK